MKEKQVLLIISIIFIYGFLAATIVENFKHKNTTNSVEAEKEYIYKYIYIEPEQKFVTTTISIIQEEEQCDEAGGLFKIIADKIITVGYNQQPESYIVKEIVCQLPQVIYNKNKSIIN